MKILPQIRKFLLPGVLFAGYFALTCWAETSICPVKAVTGLPCPGCGLTTAGMALLRGDWQAAYQANAMIFAFPPVAAIFIISLIWRNKKFSRFANIIYLIAALGLAGYFVYRLICFFPHGPYPMEVTYNTIPRRLFQLF
ncbi:MAG: DUF2752 domain-containing protein [Lentisphaerae bacterium]|nr:DUF2752 domain-containing protein [Lentisphaerota bacterium]